MWEKTAFYGVVAQAQDMVPGFKEGYRKFEQQVVIKGLSKGLLTNYGPNAAHLALHFGRCPESVSVTEFLRRFCLHILPKGFRKIRHYGILSSRNKEKLRELQTKMGVVKEQKDAIIYIHPDFRAKCCSCCGQGEMHVIMSFGAHAPPFHDMLNSINNNKLKQNNSLTR